MRKRFQYVLLFGIPGLVIASVFAMVVAASAAGVLWLFVFGDNRWPSQSTVYVLAPAVVAFVSVWGTAMYVGYSTGKRLESGLTRRLDRRHVLLSAVTTLLPMLLIAGHQLRAAVASPTDSIRCLDHCKQQGANGSELSPDATNGKYTCSCFEGGKSVLRIPLDALDAEASH